MTHLRLDPSVPRRVLRGQPEGVPPHGVQHAPPALTHAVEVGEGVGDGVDADVAHVQMAGGVREHGQHVEGRGGGISGKGISGSFEHLNS